MTFPDNRLYSLLPAVYRLRDAEEGLPLRNLLSAISREVAVVEEDLAQLYDDLFIETCAEWAVPYIGDLVGVEGLHDLKGRAGRRAQVANTVGYRRRKGTAAVLEALARDATGWPAHAVEFFGRLATTQYVNHVRPRSLATPDLRSWKLLEYARTPFDDLSHTADVRRIASRRGRHNIPNVGIFLWRLGAHPLTLSPAARLDDRRFLFSPLGADTQLFTRPEPEPDPGHVSTRMNVPDPIGRRVLHESKQDYYGLGRSILLVSVYEKVNQGASGPRYLTRVHEHPEISACNLGDGENGAWAPGPQGGIGVDPVLGRIVYSVEAPEGYDLSRVLATHHRGFAADIGGGEYDRAAEVSEEGQRVERVMMPQVRAALGTLGVAEEDQPPWSGIRDALEGLGEARSGAVEVLDSGRYEEDVAPSVSVGAGRRVEVRAADGHRPAVILGGDLEIECGSGVEITLSGLLVSGGTLTVGGALDRLRLVDCTLVPGTSLEAGGEPAHASRPSLVVASPGTTVEIERCIVGSLRVVEGSGVRVRTSILDATSMANVAYAGPDGTTLGGRLSVENSTVVGTVGAAVLKYASNSLFLGRVRTQRRQEGCVRFSYLPLDSEVPRRHRCCPGDESEASNLVPRFVSLRYGRPGYCQLAHGCPQEILGGADDESEMGAFHDLYAPQREANLRARLEEYIRFGLEAGVLYAT
jgi:hypothetical protein